MGKKKGERGEDKDYPVLLQHGAWGKSDDWTEAVWPFKLSEVGYDVWLGNNSGNDLTTFKTRGASEYEKWDFNWADMGIHDVPATIDKILDETNKSKVTYIGMSQGNAQMHYGLAKKENDYYQNTLNRFISLAPCVFDWDRSFDATYEGSMDFYQKLFDAEIYYSGGKSARWNNMKICYEYGFDSDMCQEMNNINAGTRHSWRNELYNDQIWVNDRFQEPIPVEDWVDGTTRESEELDTKI